MRISEHARAYVQANGLRATAIVSNCRRFEKITGITDVESVSTSLFVGFRQAAIALALSNVTTEKTITDVSTICKYVVGKIPDAGKRLRQPRPSPHPATLEAIDAVFRAAQSQRLKRWLALTYWTALRLADSVLLYGSLQTPDSVIRHTANKTGLHHAWPAPTWLQQWIPRVEPRTSHATVWMARMIRNELARTCVAAGIEILTPKQIRQASITEWTRANATAGSIVHGCGLGVMAHYLDPLSVLESAAPRVRLPQCFGGQVDTGEQMQQAFSRLDPQGRELILLTAERLGRAS
jgi:hypothetical protein